MMNLSSLHHRKRKHSDMWYHRKRKHSDTWYHRKRKHRDMWHHRKRKHSDMWYHRKRKHSDTWYHRKRKHRDTCYHRKRKYKCMHSITGSVNIDTYSVCIYIPSHEEEAQRHLLHHRNKKCLDTPSPQEHSSSIRTYVLQICAYVHMYVCDTDMYVRTYVHVHRNERNTFMNAHVIKWTNEM